MILEAMKAKGGKITTAELIWDTQHKVTCWTKEFTRLRRLGWPIETRDIPGQRQKIYVLQVAL
jgi:hypothetical protein